ncbi:MAG: hypothetical protein Q8O05_06295, partial [Chloroflexota bacterium]|nr:hypothetical protein [Chloroflexota bacterium]
KIKGLYTAQAGVEDALWRLKYSPPGSLPYSYELSGINGLSVSVTIEAVTELAGEQLLDTGGHADWMIITKTVTYNSGVYDYTMSIKNNDGSGNIKIEMILIDFPPSLSYQTGSTSGDFASDDPDISGTPSSGITLVWHIDPVETINSGDTKQHHFHLTGPEVVGGVEGHGLVQATRDDVGAVWDSDSYPYEIIAQAKKADGTVVETIQVGAWTGTGIDIASWRINP